MSHLLHLLVLRAIANANDLVRDTILLDVLEGGVERVVCVGEAIEEDGRARQSRTAEEVERTRANIKILPTFASFKTRMSSTPSLRINHEVNARFRGGLAGQGKEEGEKSDQLLPVPGGLR